MTKGEYRVGVSFNPSKDAMVDQIKREAANLIDLVEAIETRPVEQQGDKGYSAAAAERSRLKALAQTKIEEAAMWAVKAATKPSWT